MKRIIFMLSTNGAGKTTLFKKLIEKYEWYVVDIFEGEQWHVISQDGGKSPKAIVVGRYSPKRIFCGGDLFTTKGLPKAIEAAVKFKGADIVVVEALKFCNIVSINKLRALSHRLGCESFAIFLKANPIECTERIHKRSRISAYPLETVMRRLASSRHHWATWPANRRFEMDIIESFDHYDKAVVDLHNIIFERSKI